MEKLGASPLLVVVMVAAVVMVVKVAVVEERAEVRAVAAPCTTTKHRARRVSLLIHPWAPLKHTAHWPRGH